MLFNWILVNKLAIGTPVSSEDDIQLIKTKGILSVLDLRNNDDFKLINQNEYIQNLSDYKYKNVPLPDHKTGRLAESFEIQKAVNVLDLLFTEGPVFMHCHAAMERAPLISIAFLHLKRGLSIIQSCDYVKQQNQITNVNLRQLKCINN